MRGAVSESSLDRCFKAIQVVPLWISNSSSFHVHVHARFASISISHKKYLRIAPFVLRPCFSTSLTLHLGSGCCVPRAPTTPTTPIDGAMAAVSKPEGDEANKEEVKSR
jgi:hypothetical protein